MKNIALVGGMDRLGPHYKDEARRLGVALKVFTVLDVRTASRIRNADAVLIFTNKISHNLKREAVKAARSGKIPFFYCHACGICTLRACLECLECLECLGCDGGDAGSLGKGCADRLMSTEKGEAESIDRSPLGVWIAHHHPMAVPHENRLRSGAWQKR